MILTFSCEVMRLRHLVLLKPINKLIKWWCNMKPFRYKTAAVSVHCYGSKNSLNDKRYNGVFIKENAVRITDRSREKRSKIPLSTELIEVCICYNNLTCLEFHSSRDSLLFACDKRKQ